MLEGLLLWTQSSWKIWNGFVEIQIVGLPIVNFFVFSCLPLGQNFSTFVIDRWFEHSSFPCSPNFLQFFFFVLSALDQSFMEWGAQVPVLLSQFNGVIVQLGLKVVFRHVLELGQSLSINFCFSGLFPVIQVLHAPLIVSLVVNFWFEGATLHRIHESIRVMLAF